MDEVRDGILAVNGEESVDGSGPTELAWAGSWAMDSKASRAASRTTIRVAIARAGIHPRALIARDFIT